MDISKALTYAIKDKNWTRKLGLFAVALLIPFLNLAGTGYALEIARRVMQGNARPLPEWDHLGKKWVDGLVLGLVFLVYALPILLVAGLPVIVLVVPALLAGDSDIQGLTSLIEQASPVAFAGVGCVAGVYGLGMWLLHPAIYIRYAQVGKFGACFKLRDLFALIRRNYGAYFTALLVTIGISVAASAAGGVVGMVPVFGWVVAPLIAFAAVAYGLVVSAHLYGQVGAGFPAKGSVRSPAARSSRSKSGASTKGKHTSRASTSSRRKPASSSRIPRKAPPSTAARRKPASTARTGRKPAASGSSKRRK